MSDYEPYEAPEHADPAAEYPDAHTDMGHMDLAIGDAIGQPLIDSGYEPGGHEGTGDEYVPYEGGAEPGYAETTPGDGTPEGAQTYAPDAQAEGYEYASDSGDAAPAEGYEGGSMSTDTDDYTGNTVSYSETPTDYTPTVQ
jgi:hypothetical protein